MRWTITLAWIAGCVPEPPSTSDAFEPYAFYVDGTFAWRADEATVDGWTLGADRVEPAVTVTVYDARFFDAGDPTWTCAVTLWWDTESRGPLDAAPWTDNDPIAGVELPFAAVRTSDCPQWPSAWGPDPGRTVAAWTWGLGVGPLDGLVEASLSAAVDRDAAGAWEAEWAPVVLGGGFRWSGADDDAGAAYLSNGYAFAVQVDDTLAAVLDDEGNTRNVPAADVLTAPPTAAYVVRAWYGVDASLLQPGR